MKKIYKKNDILIKCTYRYKMVFYSVEKNDCIMQCNHFDIDNMFWQFNLYIHNLKIIIYSDCNDNLIEIKEKKEYIYDCLVLFSKQVHKTIIGL